MVDVGYNVKYFRIKNSLTKSELEKKAGVSRVTIHNIEIGLNSPSIVTLEALAKALNVTLIDLVTEREQEPLPEVKLIHYLSNEQIKKAETNGIPYITLLNRVKRGWDMERATTEKPHHKKLVKEYGR